MKTNQGYTRLLIIGAAVLILLILIIALSPRRRHIRSGRGNVILITIDTLRADKLGIYGAEDVATPALEITGPNR